MPRKRVPSVILHFFLVISCIGCATTELQEPGVNDPLERVNRAIFRFNRSADRVVLRPIANGYHVITPDPIERMLSNFFDNLSSPIIIVSDILQAKFKQAASDSGRFLLNSTVGVLGVFDVATRVGLEPHEEDLGQTLGRWGFEQGPYLMVPLFGPFTARDGIGRLLELPLEPLTHYDHDNAVRNALIMMYFIDKRARLLSVDDALADAIDPYIFLRDAYLQRRRYLLYDGDPPPIDEEFGDEFSEEDFLNDQ